MHSVFSQKRKCRCDIEVSEKIWLVSFMNYDLDFFDHESGRVECAENPFGATVTYLSGTDPPERMPRAGIEPAT
jgi:hypothetical protein